MTSTACRYMKCWIGNAVGNAVEAFYTLQLTDVTEQSWTFQTRNLEGLRVLSKVENIKSNFFLVHDVPIRLKWKGNACFF